MGLDELVVVVVCSLRPEALSLKGPRRYSYLLRTLLAEHPKAHTNHF